MAKSGHYTRGKRVAMQVTMALVLAGTAGLAAWVSRERRQELRVDLGPPVALGRVVVRMPQGQGWSVSVRHTSEWAEAVATGPDARVVSVREQPVGAAVGPRQHVALETGVAPGKVKSRVWMLDGEGAALEQSEVSVGADAHGEPIEGYALFAGTVLPPAGTGVEAVGVIVSVKGPGALGPGARALLRLVAENLDFAAGAGAMIMTTRPSTTGPTSAPTSEPTSAPAAKPPAKPGLLVRMDKQEDVAETAVGRDGTAVVAVTSPSGIGRASLQPGEGTPWPRRVVVRLVGFTALEGFDAGNDDVTVHGRLGGENTEVRRVGAGGKTGDAPDDGRYAMPMEQTDDGIEVTLPGALCREGVGTVRIQWVDAYRG
jgi:hypothetical protein